MLNLQSISLAVLKLPEMERSTESKDSSITLWRLQKNQVLAYFTYEGMMLSLTFLVRYLRRHTILISLIPGL